MLINDSGSKSWDEVQKDKHVYDFQSSFPSPSPARTTFYARDADDEMITKYNRLWKLQHGRGHTYEGWEDTHRIRPEDEFTYRRACVILSQAGVTGHVRKKALQWVVQKNLTGFSRYYGGLDGAAIGFATLFKYDTQAAALSSYLVEKAEELLDVDGEKLVDYVWRTYGPA